eukprot:TRINITY_DN2937_c0_g2_i5.p1 TRINITY_DN2937_c0_g2~~TRINITY_DN2937_c0_g2_i5.p1  ORF type:complete len:647 (-),score=113.04 TRINITY_DN2937_c0_g2_i5:37-1704(-)
MAYHQCRWNYKDEFDVATVDLEFDIKNIPYDVIWLDIEHTDGKRYFTWDTHYFPTPEKMQENIASKGRKMVTIVDPHIKRDSGYTVYKEAQDHGYYIKDRHGSEYQGWCWPGTSSYLDFSDSKVRQWWSERFHYHNYKGSTNILYTWNDMNEPSVFDGPEITMHKDAQHLDGTEHRDIHNLYGLYVHMASYEGHIIRSQPNPVRPFVLSRAFFAGTQRYGAIWTGDNTANWDHLSGSISELLSISLSGIHFCGADVGGFFGNPEPELLLRWYQAGVFYPFFRAHAHIDTKRREPWLFEDHITDNIRQAIRLRYTLLPYFYTAFFHSHKYNDPIYRPLWVEFPNDTSTFSIEDQFLFGSSLLIKPVTSQGASSISVYFPGEQVWYDWSSSTPYSGGTTATINTPLNYIPVFQRGGSIIPTKMRARRSSSQMVDDPYTLFIALDRNKEASGELYVDDGKTFEYRNGKYIRRKFDLTKENANLRLTPIPVGDGNFSLSNKLERIVVRGIDNVYQVVKTVGGVQTILETEYDRGSRTLTVRNPAVILADLDWSVNFVKQ